MRTKISLLFVFAFLMQMNVFGQQKIKDFIEEWEDYGFVDFNQWMNCKSHLEYDEIEAEDAVSLLFYSSLASTYYVHGVFEFESSSNMKVYGFIITDIRNDDKHLTTTFKIVHYDKRKKRFIPKESVNLTSYLPNLSEKCQQLYKIEETSYYYVLYTFLNDGRPENIKIDKRKGSQIYD